MATSTGAKMAKSTMATTTARLAMAIRLRRIRIHAVANRERPVATGLAVVGVEAVAVISHPLRRCE
ncbi:hypothetical protein GCM10027417_10950 [Glutamicibacter endophyticus]